MNNRIVEIVSDGVHLSLLRGFLKVSRDGAEIGRIGLPEISALIVRGYGASLSLNLAARLAELNVPVVLCGADQAPASIVWPVSGHHAQGSIAEGQAALTQPQKKRLWRSLVKAKIAAQAKALELAGESAADLKSMAREVKSGDPDNMEAQAARRYWPRMMGAVEECFTRNRSSHGANAALNYGYTVLRAGAARSIVAAGLHPGLSLHHQSRGDGLRLADDMMEPFRPWVDLAVRNLAEKSDPAAGVDLGTDEKRALVDVLTLDLESARGASPLQTCMDRLCRSLADICLQDRKDLEFPGGPVFAAAVREGDA